MTHAQSVERRRRVAEEVKGGKFASDVARKHGMSLDYVCQACRTHGVKTFGRRYDRSKDDNRHTVYKVLAGLLAGERATDIATRLDLSKQRVDQIVQLARQHGIKV